MNGSAEHWLVFATHGTVVKMTQVTAAQVPLEQNVTWQEVNRQLNVNLNLLVYTVGDYPGKLSTTVASGNLPDMFTVQTTVFPEFVQFLESSCADLTPFLAGDAIRDYPNLANYPAYTWRNACSTTRSSASHRLQVRISGSAC
ncbi:MAG: hypothetical protein JOZ87_14850 [Chloroflexi bacterium]|nr:hypothetical protein [Chloroflexota bacterium]